MFGGVFFLFLFFLGGFRGFGIYSLPSAKDAGQRAAQGCLYTSGVQRPWLPENYRVLKVAGVKGGM